MLSRHFTRSLIVTTAALALASAIPSQLRAQALAPQSLSGHVPRPAAAAGVIGRLSQDKSLKLAVGLPLRNQQGLTTLLAQIYDPQSPEYHHFLSVEQFTERFGPSKEDYQAVTAFLIEHGFRVTATSAN